MALQTRRVLPVSDGPAPVMFLTHCHRPFLFSTALQGDLLFLPARQRSTGLDHATSFKNHVETHSTGQLGGQVPSQWLEDHSLVICPACSLLISTNCHPTCNNPVSTFKERPPTGCRRRPHHSRLPQNPHPESGPGVISNNDTRSWSALSVHPQRRCSVGNEGQNKNSKRSSK